MHERTNAKTGATSAETAYYRITTVPAERAGPVFPHPPNHPPVAPRRVPRRDILGAPCPPSGCCRAPHSPASIRCVKITRLPDITGVVRTHARA